MITMTSGFTGFSVRDIDAAKNFYEGVLGLTVSQNEMGNLDVQIPGGGSFLIYPADHDPATFTVLNLVVPDIDAAVAELAENGVTVENYGGYSDDKGIMRGKSVNRGPDIAWFLDPSGNILSVLAL